MEKKNIIRLLIIYLFFSVINLNDNIYLLNKTIIFFLIGIIFIIFNKIDFKKYIRYIYILLNLILLYLLIFGDSINGSKAWLIINNISIQPSEFMKITLIIYLSILSYDKKYLLKGLIITLIPSILTFLEPDTGNVIFYILIYLSILFYKGKNNKRIFYLLLSIIVLLILLYVLFKDYLIEVFGYSIYYRLSRIISLFNGDSYQLNRAYISLSNSSILGNINNYYIPYETTDFAFSHMCSKLGLIGSISYLIFNMYFNIYLINSIKYMPSSKKIMLFSFIIMKLFQEYIHICMNIGLFPITGITLPFISYGGSSILSYYIMLSYLSNNKDNYYNCKDNYIVDS